ncbi:MAG: DUF3221 domain-containing protein [Bacillota bacterium]
MKRKSLLILLVTNLVLLIGCEGVHPDNASYDDLSDDKIIHGKVIQKRCKGITLELTGESKETFSDTIRVGVADEEKFNSIEEGQNLSVWYDFIRESNPPQTKALKIDGYSSRSQLKYGTIN